MNLFDGKPIVYKKQSSEREVYETERYYLLKVVDCSGNLEKELAKLGWEDGIECVLNKLFDAQQNSRFSKMVYSLFDADRFSVETSITEQYRGTSIAVVKVTKRRFRDKALEKVLIIMRSLFDRGDNNFYYYNF